MNRQEEINRDKFAEDLLYFINRFNSQFDSEEELELIYTNYNKLLDGDGKNTAKGVLLVNFDANKDTIKRIESRYQELKHNYVVPKDKLKLLQLKLNEIYNIVNIINNSPDLQNKIYEENLVLIDEIIEICGKIKSNLELLELI
jgi:hypothetical protein